MNILNIYIGTAVQNAFLFGFHLEITWKKNCIQSYGVSNYRKFQTEKGNMISIFESKSKWQNGGRKTDSFCSVENIKIKQIHKFDIGTQ